MQLELRWFGSAQPSTWSRLGIQDTYLAAPAWQLAAEWPPNACAHTTSYAHHPAPPPCSPPAGEHMGAAANIGINKVRSVSFLGGLWYFGGTGLALHHMLPAVPLA